MVPLWMWVFSGFPAALMAFIIYSDLGGKSVRFATGLSIVTFFLWPLVLVGAIIAMLRMMFGLAIEQIQDNSKD